MIKDDYLDHLEYCEVDNLYVLEMSQKLPVDGFSCVENTSQFNKNFMENHKADSDERKSTFLLILFILCKLLDL